MVSKQLSKYYFFATLLLACFPLFSIKIASLVVGGWVVFSIVLGIVYFKNTQHIAVKKLAIQLALFILLAFWCVIDGSTSATYLLEKSMSLALFPLAFYFSPITFSSKQITNIQLVFSGASVLIVVLGIVLAFIEIFSLLEKGSLSSMYEQTANSPDFYFYFRTAFEKYVKLHPTYASMFLGLSFLFVLQFFFKKYAALKNIYRFGFLFLFLIIILFQALLASRTPFAATLFGALLLSYFHLKNKIVVVYLLLGTIALSILLYFTVPSFAARFSEISINNTEVPQEGLGDSFNIRSGILTCSFELIKNNWLLGIGPGNVQPFLNDCYMEISPSAYENMNYNTHNQFLGYWAAFGILGPLFLLGFIFQSVWGSLKLKSYLPLIVGIFYCICFLTENTLFRQHGIVPFAFFMGLFFYENKKEV
ncbi:MAG: O-antigen ligase family protein [Vicingaceae bacterium]|nr:O-antigen ligase family protein [Vicingaceae bacterium]